ncbi:MAG: hypothetical protein HY273_05605 [Gammaproteobacteria bacterium]|nr:hypothetical protein [Gammaproteobacteria bacterium]
MENNNPSSVKKSLLIKLIVTALLLGLLWLAVSNLPRGYSRDLSLIGKGKNVVVQVHDHNLVGSIDLMESLNKVRPEYAANVEFVIADLLTPEGKSFAASHNASSVTLLFFAPDGSERGAVKGVQDPAALRNSLGQAFNLPAAK